MIVKRRLKNKQASYMYEKVGLPNLNTQVNVIFFRPFDL